MPCYQHCWDINKVLEYIKIYPDNHNLPLKTLTGKLATLMAMSAPKPSSELKLLDLRFYKKRPEGVVFNLPGLTKTSSEVRSVFFASFSTDKSLCVTTTLEVYLTKTSLPCRTLSPSRPNKLFLSYHWPYKPVQSCSISQWIKTFIGCACIDTAIFKANSTRSASTSKARNVGVSVADIQNMADWPQLPQHLGVLLLAYSFDQPCQCCFVSCTRDIVLWALN